MKNNQAMSAAAFSLVPCLLKREYHTAKQAPAADQGNGANKHLGKGVRKSEFSFCYAGRRNVDFATHHTKLTYFCISYDMIVSHCNEKVNNIIIESRAKKTTSG